MGNHQYVCGNGEYCNANATTPKPPTTHIAESHQNAYETAFEAEGNVSLNSKNFPSIPSNNLPVGFINGTFGYQEKYSNIPPINYLLSNAANYQGQPYLYLSSGAGGGNGYMYLDWVVATFGIPYEIIIP